MARPPECARSLARRWRETPRRFSGEINFAHGSYEGASWGHIVKYELKKEVRPTFAHAPVYVYRHIIRERLHACTLLGNRASAKNQCVGIDNRSHAVKQVELLVYTVLPCVCMLAFQAQASDPSWTQAEARPSL